MNQSQQNLTSHIQSYRIVFSELPPANSPHTLEGLLKLNGLRGGENDNWTLSLEKQGVYTFFNVIFSNIGVVLFLY